MLFFLTIPSVSPAEENYIFSGLVRVTYQKDKFKDPDGQSDRSTMTQEYSLQNSGFIYNRKLISYTVGGTFLKDDTDNKGLIFGDNSIRTKAIDYLLKLDFLQGTRYPFSMYAEKNTSPSVTIQPDFSITNKQVIDRYGLQGSYFMKSGINFRYDLHQDDLKTTGQNEIDRSNRSFVFGVERRRDNEIIDISYNNQHNLARDVEELEAINDARVSVWLRTGTYTNVSSDSSYTTNSNTDLKNISSNIKLNFLPTGNFNSVVSLYMNQLKQRGQTGDFETFFTSSSYRINEFFSAEQNATYYRSAGDFGEETIASLTLGLNWLRPLPYGLSLAANSAINGTSEKSDTGRNRNSTFYNVGTTVAKQIAKINTTVNIGGSYYSYSTSLGGSKTRYDMNGGFNSRIMKNLSLQSSLDYYVESTTDDTVEGQAAKTKKKQLTSDSSLVYSTKLSLKSTLDGRLGAYYSTQQESIFNNETFKRTFEYTDWVFRYALRRNIVLNAGVKYFMESINETKTLIGSIGADLKIKAVIIKLTGEMWKEKSLLGDRTRKSTFVQVSRPF